MAINPMPHSQFMHEVAVALEKHFGAKATITWNDAHPRVFIVSGYDIQRTPNGALLRFPLNGLTFEVSGKVVDEQRSPETHGT
jgi:hypothetical protein